ncbi:MarR family winged helix-turn-helix transcriptional regulator [Pendulispora albinea]|uniref:MarR family transcriptional regulator n=1 Tax=Pendulispora albinea TaxID=2741071 RepID=A0ABZ2LWG7_9BACT
MAKHARNAFKLEDSFAYHIYRCARMLRYRFTHFTGSLGVEVSQEQFFILHKLSERAGQSQIELGDELFSDRPNLTRMIATMERNGWIRREEDPKDARKLRVSLTAQGATLIARIEASILDERKRLFAKLTKSDLAELIRIVGQIETNIGAEP